MLCLFLSGPLLVSGSLCCQHWEVLLVRDTLAHLGWQL